ncbi:phage terminase large subunit [Megamonas hypermegale]|uniref:phage terminase large subunit n=1 Tax=Megamonas hypermegale TaxID=158847 RepID=UPI0026EC7189|nr:phage terminase large subunit [Megamonas hypermegale]
MIIRPQPGKQEQFLSSGADIVFYGGAAGGGKTYAALIEPLRHINNKNFSCIIFRRTSPQITTPGGLWDTALEMYTALGAKDIRSPNRYFRFPSGAKIVMNHLQYDKTVYDYQGAQIPLIEFEELTHFSWKQFAYMLTRNRSATAGIKPYIRATCNPDPDSWVADFIKWYINQDTGYAIQERGGIIRWFIIMNDEPIWADNPDELLNKYGIEPKSFTFIPSSVYDNKILLENNREYLANLKAQDEVTKEQLLNGNWKIRPAGGLYFKANQAPIVNVVPDKIIGICRAWDLAATEATPQNKSPDKTAGVLMARLRNGQFIVLDVFTGCLNAAGVRQAVRSIAIQDRINYRCNSIHIPQDPGQAGKEQAQSYVSFLAGFNVQTERINGNKINRAEPFAAQWQQGNVLLLRGDWNRIYTNELSSFPDGLHDDLVDASADAFNSLTKIRNFEALL